MLTSFFIAQIFIPIYSGITKAWLLLVSLLKGNSSYTSINL
ncbi:hypothetical protein HMPREF1869_01642 [Bacteroidales bacterium KA00251]|nr:hypothetical protein HMPREF1869_01642 [Bacteroidales bacterium KA00251]